jgi:ribosomal protein S18 acetylase RimI-like enzyme
MNLQFKKASFADIPIIEELAKTIWYKHYPSIISMEQIAYMLNEMYSIESLTQQLNEGIEFTIVYTDEQAIGYIGIGNEGKGNYFIHKFYIDTEAHRLGIGSELFNYILQTYTDAERFELMVNRENFKAINFYFKHGFKIQSVVDKDIGKGFYMNDFLMIKYNFTE